jgi:predicted GIY-YIG superfamily endonuclease
MSYRVYILRCSDGTYYVGHTDDLEARVRRHNDGRGPAYTRARRPVTLVHSEAFATEALAVTRERQLKNWSPAKKEALVRGDRALLRQLSQSRD